MTSAEMPDRRRSGRREPVRGDTSSRIAKSATDNGAESHTASGSHSAWLSPAQPWSHDADSAANSHTINQASTAASGPIGPSFDSSAYFPPSPPSSVASAPARAASPDFVCRAAQQGNHAIEETTRRYDDAPAFAVPPPPMDSLDPLRTRLYGTRMPPPRGCAARHAVPAAEVMPDTPEQTPSAGPSAYPAVPHHPSACGKRFFDGFLSDFPSGELLSPRTVEDAAVELVCEGWSGAVLDQRSECPSSSSAIPPRALYVLLPPKPQLSRLREQVMSVLEVASETLRCQMVFMILDKGCICEADCKSILHGLCYVGGTVVATGGLSGPGGVDKVSGCRLREGLVLIAVEV